MNNTNTNTNNSNNINESTNSNNKCLPPKGGLSILGGGADAQYFALDVGQRFVPLVRVPGAGGRGWSWWRKREAAELKRREREGRRRINGGRRASLEHGLRRKDPYVPAPYSLVEGFWADLHFNLRLHLRRFRRILQCRRALAYTYAPDL